eukprot:jgi/Tetstr1/462030/TSEL_007101.t1
MSAIAEQEPAACAMRGLSIDRIPSFGSDASFTSAAPSPLSVDEAVHKIARCRGFCEQIAVTAAMHPTPVTTTEVNLARLFQQAMQEIQQQLLGIEDDVARVQAE